jgi:ubiquinone/menaquinone biosynthesis C-methylase UbiE
MKSIQRGWDWWAYHFRVVHRQQIAGISQWDDELVDMIVAVLGLRPGDRVLDLACGSGDHARRLARRGMEVVGVDIAASLIAHCRQRVAEEGLTGVRFEQGDMRELDSEGEFDAVLLLSGSFGFFDDATNREVLNRMVRALRDPGPGGGEGARPAPSTAGGAAGRLLIDVFDPARMIVRPPRRSWSHYGGGYSLRTTWWEPETCTYVSEFSFIDADGVLNTAAEPERIRVYSLPEWRDLFAEARLHMTHALAETKLPLVPYDRDHYGNLVIAGRKAAP